MVGTYRAAFRAPGSKQFAAAGFIGRFAISIYPIGFVLLISLKTGHYGFAGLLSGIYVVANGVGTPILGRLVDRHGQRRLLIPATLVHLASVITIIALVQSRAPNWSLIVPTIVLGLGYLPIGSLVRARWSMVLAGQPELTTAYAFESALDEVIFTLGPLLASVLATQVAPVWVFVMAGVLGITGAVWLATQTDTEPPGHDADAPPHQSALRYPGMILLIVSTLAMGAIFATAEVTMTAFCIERGEKSFVGLVIACFAGGSAISGFLYGARRHDAPVEDRFRRQALILGLLPALFLAAVNIGTVAVIAAVVGTAIAPTLISAFGLVEKLVPTTALNEGMSWLITGLSFGYGIASTVVGHIADAASTRWAFSVGIGAGVLVCVLAVAAHTRVVALESEPVTVA